LLACGSLLESTRDEGEGEGDVVNPPSGDEAGPLPVINQRVLLAIPTGAFEGSYVTKILERLEQGFRVYAPSFRAAILPIPPKEKLQVHFNLGETHYEYDCEVIERYPGPIPTILISWPLGKVERVQRRTFYRLGATLHVSIEPVSPLPGTPPPGPPARAMSVNLSGGGILLKSPELYPNGAVVDLHLEIPDGKRPATVRAEVLRDAGRASSGGPASWFLGLEFIDAPEDAQERITRFIYLLQREIREQSRREEGET
jgi:c-di-GMP-binding flagellar brake protein YcgR